MTMLEINELYAGYGGIEILHGINLGIDTGEIVALVGSNGAGKTTTTRAISGIIEPMGGSIRYQDDEIGGEDPHQIVERGIIQVPENRDLFVGMSVRENLLLGSQTDEARADRKTAIEEMFDLFPRLEERADQRAGTMSGGEQQMLTLARALMGSPDLLVLDEPSIGLAPQLVEEMFTTIAEIHDSGLTILIIEQNVQKTLELADRGYVLENGQISLQGSGNELLDDERVVEAYLGV